MYLQMDFNGHMEKETGRVIAVVERMAMDDDNCFVFAIIWSASVGEEELESFII